MLLICSLPLQHATQGCAVLWQQRTHYHGPYIYAEHVHKPRVIINIGALYAHS
jgi:hypothetical protein